MQADCHAIVDSVYRSDWGRIVAALIRVTGDFDVAEEAAQEAFTAAVDQWPTTGVPDSPPAWILRTARNKAIDRMRRQTLLEKKLKSIRPADAVQPAELSDVESAEIPDDRLRLIFTCCHPALAH